MPSNGSRRHREGETLRVLLILLLAAPVLAGCDVVAAPFHVAGGVVGVVPVVGDVAAAPLEVTGDAID